MSGKSPALKPEVAQNGVVKIPKAVFESLPPAASAPGESIKTIKRLDGTIEEVKPSMHNKDNPNFVPRQAWPGGNIVTSNKDEALIKYHERKGIPLPPELQAKKAQLDAEAAEKKAAVFSRLGSKGSGNSGTGGRVVKLGGAEGAFNRLAGVPVPATSSLILGPWPAALRRRKASLLAGLGLRSHVRGGGGLAAPPHSRSRASVPRARLNACRLTLYRGCAGKALGEIAAPAAAPAAARPPRPKGGVKVLSGAEGARTAPCKRLGRTAAAWGGGGSWGRAPRRSPCLRPLPAPALSPAAAHASAAAPPPPPAGDARREAHGRGGC